MSVNKPTNTISIMHLADFGGPYSGNFIASLLALRHVLENKDRRLVFVFSDIAREKTWFQQLESDMGVYILPKVASPYALALRIMQIGETENSEILHTHFTTYDVAAALAALMMRSRRKVRVIWHVHSDWPIKYSLPRLIKDFIKFRVLANVVNIRVISVSEGIRDGLLRRGLFSRKADVIPNGIDLIRPTKLSSSRVNMRQDYGVSEEAFVVCAFGWAPLTKGIDTCIDACKALNSEGHDIRLILIGGEQLDDFVRQYTETASWLVVARPRECVGDFYAMADVFFAGSRNEGFPYSVGEAMACELPVAVTDIRGHRWAASSQGVVTFNVGDVSGAASVLKYIKGWSSGEKATRCYENKMFISKNYSMQAWVDKVINIYKQCIGDDSL